MKLLAVTALFGFLGVAFGAFGAHAIADTVSAARLAAYKTGVLYHLLHVLAALLVAVLAAQYPRWRQLRHIGVLFLVGVSIFSGSLYALVLFDIPALGAVTPVGGLLLLAAWGWLAVSAWGVKHDGE